MADAGKPWKESTRRESGKKAPRGGRTSPYDSVCYRSQRPFEAMFQVFPPASARCAATPRAPAVRGPSRIRRPLAVLAVLAAASLAAGCSINDPNRSGLLQPYRIDLPQGNYLTRETVDRVKEGMTRDQVRFLLGTPLLRDMFHPDRWDYVFRYKFPSGDVEQRKVTVRFRDDRVTSIEADPLPEREDPSDPALPGYRPSDTAARQP